MFKEGLKNYALVVLQYAKGKALFCLCLQNTGTDALDFGRPSMACTDALTFFRDP